MTKWPVQKPTHRKHVEHQDATYIYKKTIFGPVNTFIPLPGSLFDQNITDTVHIRVAVTVTCPTLIQRSMYTGNTVLLIRCFNFYFL